MRRKRLWKQALAVTLSATMLLGVPSEVVFASNETNEEVSAEATEPVETTESTEELEAATEANEIVTETEASQKSLTRK